MPARCLFVVAALVACAAARAGWDRPPPPVADPRLGAPPQADPSPTGWACNLDTLVSGESCVFEADPPGLADPPRQAAENVAGVVALAPVACARAARRPADPRPEPGAVALCRREFEERARTCNVDGGAVLDTTGHFAARGRACYGRLQEVLTRARFLAAAAGPCCACAVENGCAASAEACHRAAAGFTLERPACVERACAQACQAFLPIPEPSLPPSPLPPGFPEPPPPPPPAARPAAQPVAPGAQHT
jgi:hypothetical protein